MGKNCLSLILVMVIFSLHFTILILITFLGYPRLVQIYFQYINFVYKIMHFVILMPINSQFRIYLRGRSYTKGWVKMVFIPFHLLLLFNLHLHPLSIQVALLLFLHKLYFGIKGLGILVPRYCILPYCILPYPLSIQVALSNVPSIIIFGSSDICSQCVSCISAKCTNFLFQNMYLVLLLLWNQFILMLGALLLLYLYLNTSFMWYLLMILLVLLGYSCLNISLMCLVCFYILSLLLRISSIPKSRLWGLMVVVNF